MVTESRKTKCIQFTRAIVIYVSYYIKLYDHGLYTSIFIYIYGLVDGDIIRVYIALKNIYNEIARIKKSKLNSFFPHIILSAVPRKKKKKQNTKHEAVILVLLLRSCIIRVILRSREKYYSYITAAVAPDTRKMNITIVCYNISAHLASAQHQNENLKNNKLVQRYYEIKTRPS